MTNEEKLEYAKENYPAGTKFKPAYYCGNSLCTVKGFYHLTSLDIWCQIEETGGDQCLYDDDKNLWAEIISKPENKEEMTHEEAIETLKTINSTCVKKGLCDNDSDWALSLQYAINQLKQCEVFPEPKEMDVSDFDDDTLATRLVHGTFKGKFIGSDGLYESLHGWDKARPIKQEPLSYKDWIDKKYPYGKTYSLAEVCEIGNKYQEYLKEFKEDNQ